MFAATGLEGFLNNGIAYLLVMGIVIKMLWDKFVPPGMKGTAAGLAEKKGTSVLRKWLG